MLGNNRIDKYFQYRKKKYPNILKIKKPYILYLGSTFLFREELECLKIENIKFAKAYGVSNPITGQYLELNIELENKKFSQEDMKIKILEKLKSKLPKHMIPSRIKISKLKLSHRFKKL